MGDSWDDWDADEFEVKLPGATVVDEAKFAGEDATPAEPKYSVPPPQPR